MGFAHQHPRLALRCSFDGNFCVSTFFVGLWWFDALMTSKVSPGCQSYTCRHELGLPDLQCHYRFCSDILCGGGAEAVRATCKEGCLLTEHGDERAICGQSLDVCLTKSITQP